MSTPYSAYCEAPIGLSSLTSATSRLSLPVTLSIAVLEFDEECTHFQLAILFVGEIGRRHVK